MAQSRGQELYEAWSKQRPKGVRLRDVEHVLQRYFPEHHRPGRSHAYVVEHPWLKAHPEFRGGRCNVTVVHGRERQGDIVYDESLADLLLAIAWVETGRQKGLDERFELDDDRQSGSKRRR